MTAIDQGAGLEGVEAALHYVSPAAPHSLRYVGGGQEINTATFEPHMVFIRDARASFEPLTLQTTGFQLARQQPAVALYDDDQAAAAYPAEIEALLGAMLNPDRIALFRPRRRHMTQSQGEVLPGATDVHVDYDAPDSQVLARRLLGLDRDAELPYSRFMAINLWRVLTPPPQDRPLAVCDARTATRRGTRNTLISVDVMPPPETLLQVPPDDPDLRSGFLFHFDPDQRWYYYPEMTTDEVLLFKLYDSIESGPWRCPHTSFADPGATSAPPRESYEIRSFVYFK